MPTISTTVAMWNQLRATRRRLLARTTDPVAPERARGATERARPASRGLDDRTDDSDSSLRKLFWLPPLF